MPRLGSSLSPPPGGAPPPPHLQRSAFYSTDTGTLTQSDAGIAKYEEDSSIISTSRRESAALVYSQSGFAISKLAAEAISFNHVLNLCTSLVHFKSYRSDDKSVA